MTGTTGLEGVAVFGARVTGSLFLTGAAGCSETGVVGATGFFVSAGIAGCPVGCPGTLGVANFAGLEGCAIGCVAMTVVTGSATVVESTESVQALRTPSAIRASALETSVLETSVLGGMVGNAGDAKIENFIGASGGRLTDSSSTRAHRLRPAP